MIKYLLKTQFLVLSVLILWGCGKSESIKTDLQKLALTSVITPRLHTSSSLHHQAYP